MSAIATTTSLESFDGFDTSHIADNISICNGVFENFHKICRFCLGFDNLKPFSDMTYKQTSVQNIIYDCSSLKVTSEDHLPHNLCGACIAELIRCYKFRNRCIEATFVLQDAYNNRDLRETNERSIQFKDSECSDKNQEKLINRIPTIVEDNCLENTKTDNLIIKKEDIDDSNDSFHNTNNNNFIIKSEEIEAPLIHDNNLSEDLMIKNEEIENMLIICNDNAFENTENYLFIKNEEIEDDPTISYDNISQDTNRDDTIDNEIKNIKTDDTENSAKITFTQTKSKYLVCDDKTYSENCKNIQFQEYKYQNCKICKKKLKKDEIRDNCYGKPYICTACDETSSVPEEWDRAIYTEEQSHDYKQIVTADEFETCNICKKSFSNRRYFDMHMPIHTNERPYTCSICKESFVEESSFSRHIQIHMEDRPYKCSLCVKSYIKKACLTRHMLIHIDERPHKCTICQKSYSHKSTFNVHTLTHANERQHKCNVCGKSFARSYHLEMHMLIHGNKRPHKCSICMKTFTWKSNLTAHMVTHTGASPHKCTFCTKSFARKFCLTKHLLIHKGEKPHTCSVCMRSFTDKSNMKRHSLTHTGEKPHQCSVCKRCFLLKNNLMKHMLIHVGKQLRADISGS